MAELLRNGNLWFLILVLTAQLLGVLGTLFMRRGRVPILGWPSEYLFFSAMGLVGLLTMIAAACGSGYWLGCGAVLCMMAVGVATPAMPQKAITTWV